MIKTTNIKVQILNTKNEGLDDKQKQKTNEGPDNKNKEHECPDDKNKTKRRSGS